MNMYHTAPETVPEPCGLRYVCQFTQDFWGLEYAATLVKNGLRTHLMLLYAV